MVAGVMGYAIKRSYRRYDVVMKLMSGGPSFAKPRPSMFDLRCKGSSMRYHLHSFVHNCNNGFDSDPSKGMRSLDIRFNGLLTCLRSHRLP